MTIEEFGKIVAAHGGYRDDPVAVDPEVETQDRFGRSTKGPNPTPKYRYLFNDGTSLEAVTRPDGAIQVVNPGTALNVAGVKAADGPDAKGPTLHTFPDGSLRQWDPQTNDWTILATKPQGPQLNEAPTLHTLPDGSQAQWNPATSKWDVVATKPKAPLKPVDLDLGAPRPGQRTDLRLVQQQYNLYAQQLAADPSLTPEAYTQKLQAYIATYVTPAVERATQEANAEADRIRQRQEQQDARAVSSEERQTRTLEARQRLDEEKFAYGAGRDAVGDALALLKYQANPAFAGEFAAALSSASRGGDVSFSPAALSLNLPDTTAIAEAAAQRAAAHYAARSVPVAPVAGAAAAPVTPAAVPPEVAASLAAAPMLPRTMPGAGGAPVPRAPEPIDPRLLQGAGGPGGLPQY